MGLQEMGQPLYAFLGGHRLAGRTLGDMVEGGQVSRTKIGRRAVYTMANGVD
jgi:hypothetical protein